MDPLALWGAVTGSVGASVSLRREWVATRRNLAVGLGVNFNVSRQEPVGEILQAWAAVALWNRGGRPLAVERAGFEFMVSHEETAEPIDNPRQVRVEITFEDAIELPVDGPTHKVYTPLGPLLAAGVNPFFSLRGFALTTGDRKWLSAPRPLIAAIPPAPITRELLVEGLQRLRADAETPPVVGDTFAVQPEQPFLSTEDEGL